MKQLALFDIAPSDSISNVVNVASIPQRSPFRYPGGKTWFVPTARKWFDKNRGKTLIEPFCGGAIISLTAVMEDWLDHAVMVELDEDVASVWKTILSDDCQWLVDKILSFRMCMENVECVLENHPNDEKEKAFQTIIRNRINHGGILARGAGIAKKGESGKGLSSRWYPSTIAKRILQINLKSSSFSFYKGNAFDFIEKYKDDENACFFVDPPYTLAGKRLYNYHEIDNDLLVEKLTEIKGNFVLTYDDADEIRDIANYYGLQWRTIPMQTTHLVTKEELIISNNFDWM